MVRSIGDRMSPEIIEYLSDALQEAAMPFQNHGGCGFFAKETYRLLKKLGYSPKIRGYNWDVAPEEFESGRIRGAYG